VLLSDGFSVCEERPDCEEKKAEQPEIKADLHRFQLVLRDATLIARDLASEECPCMIGDDEGDVTS
jgi:hypothetical protein